MYNWRRKVECLEYDTGCLLFGVNDIRRLSAKKKTITISYFQLLISTAKSILVKAHEYSPETAAYARSYMHVIPLFLNEKDGFLVIDNDNKNILRDFSKAARCGEIAQGINYFLAKDYLNAYAVYDFMYYIKNKVLGITAKYKGRIPDYILCYPDGTIGILESKGTLAANPTRYLSSGCEQCQTGRTFLSANGVDVRNEYVSAVSFATSSSAMKRETKIYLVDPENDVNIKDQDIEKNRMYEYAKWFYLADNKIITEKLMKGEKVSRKDFETLMKYDNEDVIITTFDIKDEFYKNRMKLILGIKASLMEYFITGDTSKLEHYEHKWSEREEVFEDGTFIRVVEG